MFSQAYPHITEWVQDRGWIEIGYDDFNQSYIRALDIGGMIWEGAPSYETLEDALQALESALEAWYRENG